MQNQAHPQDLVTVDAAQDENGEDDDEEAEEAKKASAKCPKKKPTLTEWTDEVLLEYRGDVYALAWLDAGSPAAHLGGKTSAELAKSFKSVKEKSDVLESRDPADSRKRQRTQELSMDCNKRGERGGSELPPQAAARQNAQTVRDLCLAAAAQDTSRMQSHDAALRVWELKYNMLDKQDERARASGDPVRIAAAEKALQELGNPPEAPEATPIKDLWVMAFTPPPPPHAHTQYTHSPLPPTHTHNTPSVCVWAHLGAFAA